MNPLLRNVVPPDGLTGTLVKTITELQKERQSLSEENDQLKTMNQLLLMANQVLMDKLGMANPEGMNGQLVCPSTHPSQLPPQMLSLLSQVLHPSGPPVSKEKIEKVSKKIDGMEKKCQMIFSLLENQLGITNLTSNQIEKAPSFVVPTVQKTRIPKVSSKRNSHKKPVNVDKLMDKILSEKTETSNVPSTSPASAQAIIDTSASVPISMSQISATHNLQGILFNKNSENIGMCGLPENKSPNPTAMNVTEQPTPIFPVESFNSLSGDTPNQMEHAIQNTQAGNCDSSEFQEMLEYLNIPQPRITIPSASPQPPTDVPAHFNFSPDRAGLPGTSSPSSEVLSSPDTETPTGSDPFLNSQMSMLRAMLQGPQNNSPPIPSPTAIVPSLGNFSSDHQPPNPIQNPINVIPKLSFGEALLRWSQWPNRTKKLDPIDLEPFLFNPFGIQAVPQVRLSAHDGSYLYRYCLKRGLVVNPKFKYWGRLSLRVQSEWLDLAETLSKWQLEQIRMGLILTMNQTKTIKMDEDFEGVTLC